MVEDAQSFNLITSIVVHETRFICWLFPFKFCSLSPKLFVFWGYGISLCWIAGCWPFGIGFYWELLLFGQPFPNISLNSLHYWLELSWFNWYYHVLYCGCFSGGFEACRTVIEPQLLSKSTTDNRALNHGNSARRKPWILRISRMKFFIVVRFSENCPASGLMHELIVSHSFYFGALTFLWKTREFLY